MKPTVDIDAIAALARLSFSEEEKERFSKDLEAMLALAEHLSDQRADSLTDGVSFDALREDGETFAFPREALLAAAPREIDGCVAVPRVVEEGDA